MNAKTKTLTARVQNWTERVASEEAEITRLNADMPVAAPKSPRARHIRANITAAESRLRTAKRRLNDARKALAEVTEPTEPTAYSRIAPDAEFIGAGDEVAIIATDGQSFDGFGILVDVDAVNKPNGPEATVNVNGVWVRVDFDRVAHCDSAQAEAVSVFGVRTVLPFEPKTCPLCESDDLGVFAADETREDEADIVECNACHWTAGLTPEGVEELNQH